MSDTGKPRTPGAQKKKSGGARPASSSMRDGVSERVEDGGSVAKVVPDEDDVTPADKAKADDTVRIRTSAADQPWKKQPPKDDDTPVDGTPVTGTEPTAPFVRPAAPTGRPAGTAPANPTPTPTPTPNPKPAPGSGPASGSGKPPFPSTSSSRDMFRPASGAASPGASAGPRGASALSGGPPAAAPAGGSAGAPAPAGAKPAGGAVRGLSFGTAERSGVNSESAKDKKTGFRAPRKAHLVLRRIEPWSAMKFSFVVSLVCFVVLFVAVAVLYGVLSGLGVFTSITDAVTQLTTGESKTASTIDIGSWFEPVRILGYTALLGAVNVVLITALSTLGAVIYNISADLVGGIEVTFSEAE